MDPFRFKKFKLYHHRSPMKIGVDSMLLGSWTEVKDAKSVLDIGTGCGLLSFMCAQKNDHCVVEGIDINSDAIIEAEENRALSPWPDRINFKKQDLKLFNPTLKYDVIISNPPFFNKESLHSSNNARAKARHTIELELEDIFDFAFRHLSEEGTLNMVLPYHEYEKVQKLAFNNGLKVQRLSIVKPKEHKPAHRVLLELGKTTKQPKVDEIIIRKLDGGYTKTYKILTEAYYQYG